MKQRDWDLHWLAMAKQNSNLSKDPITKVGAAIVTSDNRQVSFGYNGFPAGVEETTERWQRPNKYDWVIHAEVNAIINCPFDTKGCSIYLTMAPCHKCIGIILNAGIKRVIYDGDYKRLECKEIWQEISEQFDHFENISGRVQKGENNCCLSH